MATALMRLTTGVAYVRSISGTISVASITASGTVSLADGATATPSLTFTNDTDTGLFWASNSLYVGICGTVRLRIHGLSNGSVATFNQGLGIGNTSDTGD